MRITYLDHSGFSVEIGENLLIFDYWNDKGDAGKIDPTQLKNYKGVYVFASHSHGDHYNPVIFKWRNAGNLHYILSDDIHTKEEAVFLRPLQKRDVGDIRVQTFDSTDQGVSFLVELGGRVVFHAGDLNCWHWREESSPEEAKKATDAFHAAMRPIIENWGPNSGHKIDLAFFPVDGRLGRDCDEGALYFIEKLRPTVLIPMHFWEDKKIPMAFRQKNQNSLTRVEILTERGKTLELPK